MDILASIIFFSLVNAARSSSVDMTMNDFEILDGIYVPKERPNLSDNLADKDISSSARENKDTENDDSDDNDDDDDADDKVYDDIISDEDTVEEDEEFTRHLPTNCHVCRLLVVELHRRLAKFGRVRKERENKPPIYFKEEKVVLLAMENLCRQMTKYSVRPSQPFRYVRQVKSVMRKELEDALKDSKVKRLMFLSGEDDIDDPTGEIARLQQKCHALLVKYQSTIIHWFMKTQKRDLIEWFCRQKVLDHKDKDCLDIELPVRRRTSRGKSINVENGLQKDEL